MYLFHTCQQHLMCFCITLCQFLEVLVTKLATAIDKDSDYINKRRQKATAK